MKCVNTTPMLHEVAESDDFKGWFARQSADVQQLSQTNPLGAAQVMTMYKQSAGTPASSTQAPSKITQAQSFKRAAGKNPLATNHFRPTACS